jgi:hypothetical protein
MNNELFLSLYDSLTRKLAFDIQDKTAMRSVRIVQYALGRKQAPVILCESVAPGYAMYNAYYPLDEASYREALPRCGILRYNQINVFNNQFDTKAKRVYDCGLDLRDGVFCIYGSLMMFAAPDDPWEALKQLYYFVDIFASCLGLQLAPVELEWYNKYE